MKGSIILILVQLTNVIILFILINLFDFHSSHLSIDLIENENKLINDNFIESNLKIGVICVPGIKCIQHKYLSFIDVENIGLDVLNKKDFFPTDIKIQFII